MALDASLDAALQGAAPLVCLLIKIELPDHTIRVVDGAGEVIFGGETYTGEDSVYGVLDQVESMAEQVGTEAPTVRFTFLPASISALAAITAPANQGSVVTVWFGAVDPVSGLIIGEPELLFLGDLDTADVDVSSASTVITFDVVSGWERLFEASEGQRLNNSFHRWTVWGGASTEKGFEFVTQIQREEPWGYDGPRPRVVADTNGGRPGGGSNPPPTGGGGGGGGIGRGDRWPGIGMIGL